MVLHVDWQPHRDALGIKLHPTELQPLNDLAIVSSAAFEHLYNIIDTFGMGLQNPDNLDLEALLRKVIWVHTKAVLRSFQAQLSTGLYSAFFGKPGEVILDIDGAPEISTYSSTVFGNLRAFCRIFVPRSIAGQSLCG